MLFFIKFSIVHVIFPNVSNFNQSSIFRSSVSRLSMGLIKVLLAVECNRLLLTCFDITTKITLSWNYITKIQTVTLFLVFNRDLLEIIQNLGKIKHQVSRWLYILLLLIFRTWHECCKREKAFFNLDPPPK